MTRLARHAATYARHGIAVFPCTPGAKTPLPGSRGFHDATTNPEQVAEWWRRHPNANIGAPTGLLFDVLDFDFKVTSDGEAVKDPQESLDTLRAAGMLLGCIGEATTRHGGVHYYFPASGHRNGTLPGLHVDFRGAGGYVIAPPSVVPPDPGIGGPGRYTWDRVLDLADPRGEPFNWAAAKALLQPPAPRTPGNPNRASGGSIDHLDTWLRSQGEGNRNQGLYWAACKALSDGLDPWQLRDAATATGLPDHEVRRTIESATRGSGAA